MSATPRPPRLTALAHQAQRRLGPLPLDAGVEIVAEHLRCSTAAGETTRNSAVTQMRAIREATAWAALEGATTIDDAAPHLERWIASPDLGRSGQVQAPSVATQHRRRTAVRGMYSLLRRLGLTAATPCIDTTLGPRPTPSGPLLTDEEFGRATWKAEQTTSLVQPTALALAAAGCTAGELGYITAEHVDPVTWTVDAPGSGKARARLLTIRVEHRDLVLERLELNAEAEIEPSAPLLYCGSSGLEHKRSSMISKALSALGDSAHVRLTAGRLNAWAARKVYEEKKDVAAAANLLGLGSLDTAARIIGFDWRADR